MRQIQKDMGGTIKIAQIIEKFPENISSRNFIESLSDYLAKNYKNVEGKKRFGISQYKKELSLSKIISEIKQQLRAQKISVRFVNKGNSNITSDRIIHEKLLSEKGCELNIVKIEDQLCIAKTISVQDIEEYSFRDYDRPYRDAKKGMLPPKLAQIMINLSKKDPHKSILWDPFCGTGVVLMEALLMGYEVIGSDNDTKAVKRAEENIIWLYEHFGYDQKAKLFHHDASKRVSEDIEVDTIVCEPFLGPPIHYNIPVNTIKNNMEMLENLYFSFFKSAKEVLKKDGVIVFLLPVFQIGKQKYFFEKILEKIAKLGYRSECLINTALQKKFDISVNERKSLIYSRSGQVVGREIWRFHV